MLNPPDLLLCQLQIHHNRPALGKVVLHHVKRLYRGMGSAQQFVNLVFGLECVGPADLLVIPHEHDNVAGRKFLDTDSNLHGMRLAA